MRFSTIAFAFGLPATFVAATPATAQLQDLQSAVKGMETGLNNWNGNFLSLPPLRRQAHTLRSQIEDMGRFCEKQGSRPADEEEPFAAEAKQAINVLGDMMNAAVESKSKFSNIPMGTSAMYGILKSFHATTDRTMDSCIQGASPEAKAQLQAMQAVADEHFTNALDQFAKSL